MGWKHSKIWDGQDMLGTRSRTLQLDYEMTPTGSCVKGLIPAGGIILGSAKKGRWSQAGGSGCLGQDDPESYNPVLAPVLCPVLQTCEKLGHPRWVFLLPWRREPHAFEPSLLGWSDLLTPRAKINFSSFTLCLSDSLSSQTGKVSSLGPRRKRNRVRSNTAGTKHS